MTDATMTIDCSITCDLDTVNRTIAAILDDDPENALSLVELSQETLPWDSSVRVSDKLNLKLFADVAESTFWLLTGDGLTPSPLVEAGAEGTIDAVAPGASRVIHASFATGDDELCHCDVDFDCAERKVPRF